MWAKEDWGGGTAPGPLARRLAGSGEAGWVGGGVCALQCVIARGGVYTKVQDHIGPRRNMTRVSLTDK